MVFIFLRLLIWVRTTMFLHSRKKCNETFLPFDLSFFTSEKKLISRRNFANIKSPSLNNGKCKSSDVQDWKNGSQRVKTDDMLKLIIRFFWSHWKPSLQAFVWFKWNLTRSIRSHCNRKQFRAAFYHFMPLWRLRCYLLMRPFQRNVILYFEDEYSSDEESLSEVEGIHHLLRYCKLWFLKELL